MASTKLSTTVLSLIGAAALACAGIATAQDAAILDPAAAPGETPGSVVNLNYREEAPHRFQLSEGARGVELELAADGQAVGAPLDISIAHRASLGADDNGDINRRGRGAEVRVGRNLATAAPSAQGGQARWYVFAASDDEAVTWGPGGRGDIAGVDGLNRQDRVEIGDMQAGVTYERDGVQASLAYVEREISSTVGRHTVSRDENFAGVTLTMRR